MSAVFFLCCSLVCLLVGVVWTPGAPLSSCVCIIIQRVCVCVFTSATCDWMQYTAENITSQSLCLLLLSSTYRFCFLNQFKRWVWVSDKAYKFKGFNKLAYFLVKNNLLMFVNISTYSFWVARLERKKKPSVNDLLTFITDIFITKWVKY